jgi:hypothetical protein
MFDILYVGKMPSVLSETTLAASSEFFGRVNVFSEKSVHAIVYNTLYYNITNL